MEFGQIENYLHILGSLLTIVAHLAFEKDGHSCFNIDQFDVIMNIIQIIIFWLWTAVPLKKESRVVDFIRKHYNRISFWARVGSSVTQFVLSYFLDDRCFWEIKDLLRFKPYWVIGAYRVCTFIGCTMYECYHKRTFKYTAVESV